MKIEKVLLAMFIGFLLCPSVSAARFNPFGITTSTQGVTLSEGVNAFNRGDYNAAIDALERYAKSFPQDPEPHYWLNKCYEQVVKPGKSADSLTLYQKLQSHQDQIIAFAKEPEPSKVYAAQLKAEPGRNKLRVLFAIALLREKEFSKAEAEGERLLPLLDSDENKSLRQAVLVVISDIYASQKRIPEAKDKLREAMSIRGNGTFLRQKMQDCLQLEEGLPSEGEQNLLAQFNEMIRLASDLLKENKAKEALEAVNEAIELKPDDAGARGLRGTLSLRLSKEYAAEGQRLFDQKDFEGAGDALKKALSLNPENEAAQELEKQIVLQVQSQESTASIASPSTAVATASSPILEAPAHPLPVK